MKKIGHRKRAYDDALNGVAFGSKHTTASMRFKQKALQPQTVTQVQIVMAAGVDPDECETRKHMSSTATELYAPLRDSPSSYFIHKGMITMCFLEDVGGIGRTHLSNDSCLIATATPAGIPQNAKLFFPAISLIDQHPGNFQVTIKPHGVESFIWTGTNDVRAGDMMVVDPCAAMVPNGPGGRLVSQLEPPAGVDPEHIPFNVKGFNPVRAQQWETQLLDEARIRMGEGSFRADVTACTKWEDLRELIRKFCMQLIDDLFRYSLDDPSRGWIELHAAKLLHTLTMTSGAVAIRSHGLMTKQALLQVMIDIQKHYEDTAERWMARIPARYMDNKDPLETDAHGYGLQTDLLKRYMAGTITQWEEMAEADAIVFHCFDHYARLQGHRLRDFLTRFTLGMSLNHAQPGHLVDGLIGKK